MKVLKIVSVSVALVSLLGASALASGNGTGIVGSPHDFSTEGWNTARVEICRVCHIPHDHGRTLGDNGLLWNHEVTTQTFTMYSSILGPLDGTMDPQPSGVSKLCLSCHDGTVAVDNFDGNTAGTVYIGDYDADYEIDADLNRTHPISITYNTADPGLNPLTTTMGTSGTIEDVLDNGKVQCSSCHDVHDQESVSGTHLLRVRQKGDPGTGNGASDLCLTCHIK